MVENPTIPLYTTYYQSEIGLLEISGIETAITSVCFVPEADTTAASPLTPAVLKRCVTQLDEYFNGDRRQFSLPLAPQGTRFQQAVWQQLRTIPYGQTASYLEIALAIGNDKAVRAVGAANGRNPVSVVVPCHRVIGVNGKLTGYGGGLWRKEWLLKHEGWQPHPQLSLF